MSSIQQREQEVIDALPQGLFIGGEWVSPQTGVGVENPATGAVFAEVADATPEQAGQALDAAVAAAPEWAASKPRDRAELLRRVFELIEERRELFATCMTMEMGKTYKEALGEGAYGNEYIRWYSEQACRIEGYTAPAPASGRRILAEKVPVGPVLAITPWNFPLAMATRKIAPALAAGCTVVCKPAKLTPLAMLLFAQVLADAGLPAGVVNIFTTADSGATTGPLIADPRIRKITFTGSTEVGIGLLKSAADRVLRSSMELGGNAPLIVLPDADLDQAVAGAMDAKMRNLGESCIAANRLLVHESLIDEFTDRFTAAMAAQRVGYGLEERRPGRGRPARQGAGASAGCHRRRRSPYHRRPGDRRAGVLHGAHRGYRYPARYPNPHRGDLRALRPDHFLRHRRRGGRVGQRHRLRAGQLRVLDRHRTRRPGGPPYRERYRRHQCGCDLRCRRTLRRGQDVWAGTRGQPAGH